MAAEGAMEVDQMSRDGLTLTITMTNRRPVTIVKTEWPILASARTADGSNKLFVRRHADGRCLVYGITPTERRGILVPADYDLEATLHLVTLGSEPLSALVPVVAEKGYANLPPEVL